MNSKLEIKEKNVVRLEITVEAGKFEDGLQKSYLKNRSKYNIPGFRKGRVPRQLVEKYFGEAVLYEDALNIIFPDAYDEAIEEHNIEPVDKPEIDIDFDSIEKGKEVLFTAEVTVKPQVQLGNYKGIELEKIEYNVTDDDVDKQINDMVEKNARFNTVEDREIKDGDRVTIDFKGYIDDIEFEGGAAENFNLVIGEGRFVPGFEEQLIGHNIDTEVIVNIKFPDDYGKDDIAGKDARFDVKIKEIKEKELPKLDDEFAKDISEFDTFNELKKDLKDKLIEDAINKSKLEMKNKLIQGVTDNAEVDIPEIMVETELESIINDYATRMRYQGMELETYLKAVGQNLEDFKVSFKEQAYTNVKTNLVLESIIKAEDIQVEDKDLEEELKKTADIYKQKLEDFKAKIDDRQLLYIKENLKTQKTIDYLMDNAKIVEKVSKKKKTEKTTSE